MASSYTPLIADGDSEFYKYEWPAGKPIGFRSLFRLSLATFLLLLACLGCQIYLTIVIEGIGQYTDVDQSGTTVWASSVGVAASGYMMWVTYHGNNGKPGMKGHLLLSVLFCTVTAGGLVTAMGFNATTALDAVLTNIDDTSRRCIYYNSTFTSTAHPAVTMPPGCDACDPARYYYRNPMPRRFCCCCVLPPIAWDGASVTFYGVDSCELVLETVYPNAVASAVIYGVCTILMLTVASVGCIVGCQCHCCSDNCGPFPDPQYWARLRESTRVGVAGNVPHIQHHPLPVPIIARSVTEVPASYTTLSAPKDDHEGVSRPQCNSQSQPHSVQQSGGWTAPSNLPSYTDVHKGGC